MSFKSSRAAGRLDVRLDTSLELLLERAPREPIARALATVVATAGSTYRKPGARMLIMADGSYLGLLSGGCLEADLKLHAQQVIESGAARAIEYDMRGPDDILFGIGAGCEGAMRVLLEPANAGKRGGRGAGRRGTLHRARTCEHVSLRFTNRPRRRSALTAWSRCRRISRRRPSNRSLRPLRARSCSITAAIVCALS